VERDVERRGRQRVAALADVGELVDQVEEREQRQQRHEDRERRDQHVAADVARERLHAAAPWAAGGLISKRLSAR
jgi:hypothetical protein